MSTSSCATSSIRSSATLNPRSARDVKHMIDLYDPSGTNVRQLRLTLEKSEKQMTRLHKQRQSIDEAIGELSGLMTQLRERLAAKPTSRLAS